MAVALVGTPTHTGDDVSTTLRAVDVPLGTASDDIAVVFLSRWELSAKNAITAPANFTHYATTYHSGNGNEDLDIFWKRLTAGDTGTYSFSWTGANYSHANCFMIRGAVTSGDPIETINAWAGTAGTFGTTSVTVATAAALLWKAYNDSAGTHTPPTDFTEVIDTDSGTAAYRLPGSSGLYSAASGSVTSSSSSAAVLLGIKAEEAGGLEVALETISDEARAAFLIELGLAEPQLLSNVDLCKLVREDALQTTLTVIDEWTPARQYWDYLKIVRDA